VAFFHTEHRLHRSGQRPLKGSLRKQVQFPSGGDFRIEPPKFAAAYVSARIAHEELPGEQHHWTASMDGVARRWFFVRHEAVQESKGAVDQIGFGFGHTR
jgi:hypothetical protein